MHGGAPARIFRVERQRGGVSAAEQSLCAAEQREAAARVCGEAAGWEIGVPAVWLGCLIRHEPGDLGVRAQGVISARSAAVSVERAGDAGGGRRTWQAGPGGRRVRAGALACGPGWQWVQRAGRNEHGCRLSRVSGPRDAGLGRSTRALGWWRCCALGWTERSRDGLGQRRRGRAGLLSGKGSGPG